MLTSSQDYHSPKSHISTNSEHKQRNVLLALHQPLRLGRHLRDLLPKHDKILWTHPRIHGPVQQTVVYRLPQLLPTLHQQTGFPIELHDLCRMVWQVARLISIRAAANPPIQILRMAVEHLREKRGAAIMLALGADSQTRPVSVLVGLVKRLGISQDARITIRKDLLVVPLELCLLKVQAKPSA